MYFQLFGIRIIHKPIDYERKRTMEIGQMVKKLKLKMNKWTPVWHITRNTLSLRHSNLCTKKLKPH